MDNTATDRALDDAARQRVLAEQMAPLFQSPLRLFGHVFNAALVVAVLWGGVPAPILLGWLTAATLVAAGRVAICLAYARTNPPETEIQRWIHLYFAGALAAAMVWGAASFVIWLHPSFVAHAFVAFVIGGTTAAVAMMTYAHLPSLHIFLLFGGVPVAGNLMMKGDGVYMAMGAMVMLFIVLAMGYARRANAILTRSLVLREVNQGLVDDLSAARDMLERRVEERTADLDRANAELRAEMEAHKETESRLRQAQKMEAVGQLTGGVAHDFNNLLSVIQGNIELAADKGLLQGEFAREMAAIQRASTRGADLTRQLLAFSRRQTLQPSAVDVNSLILSMIGLLERTLGEFIDIRFVPDGEACIAKVDPGQLENALLNLAINARDAMPEGGTLRIALAAGRFEFDGHSEGASIARPSEAPAAQPCVVVAVSDTGIGIAAEDLEKVWEPFFTSKGVGEGSGLGLSMIYGFIKQSGGQVEIESTEGEGTTVRLYLPMAAGDPADTKAEAGGA